MVTSTAANILRLPPGFGQICHMGPADLLALKDKGQTPGEALLSQPPELILKAGRIQLVSADLVPICPPAELASLHKIHVTGRGTYMVAAPISPMLPQTKEVLQLPLMLAGKAVAG
jgi:hypothetical protein